MSKDRKKLLHIHSSVNDKQPTPATLELGELGVNNAKGNAFISTKNSEGEVVRFSEDETVIGWMEQKEVFPYEGYMRGADNSQVDGVTEQDLLDNKSNLIIKLNQVVPENTDYSPYDEKVNGAKDIYGNSINPISSGGYKDGAGLAIDMSKYVMIGANPSFSSITTTCHTTLNGTTEINGKGDGCGSKFTVDVANACVDASDTLNEYGVNHSNFGTSCDGTKISNDTTLKGKKVLIDSPSGDLTVDIQACNHISGRTDDFVIRECQSNRGKVEIDTTDIDVSASTTDVKSCDAIKLESRNIILTDGDCGNGEITLETDNIYLTANDKFCEKANDSYFYGVNSIVIGKDCDDNLTPNITYWRNSEQVCKDGVVGFSATTVDGALDEVYHRSQVSMTSTGNTTGIDVPVPDTGTSIVRSGSTTYTIHQDSDGCDKTYDFTVDNTIVSMSAYTYGADEELAKKYSFWQYIGDKRVEIGEINIPKDHILKDVSVVWGTLNGSTFTPCTQASENCHWYIKLVWNVFDPSTGHPDDKVTYLPADEFITDIDDDNSNTDRGANVDVWYDGKQNWVSADTKLHFDTTIGDFKYERKNGEHYVSGTTLTFNSGAFTETTVKKYEPWSTSNTVNIPTCVSHLGRAKLSWTYGSVCDAANDSYDPGSKCDLSTGSTFIIPKTISDVTCGDVVNDSCLEINKSVCVSGDITASRAVYSSDIKLKENIKPIDIDKILKANKVKLKSFNFKDDEEKRETYGVIAQEVEEIGLNELVHLKQDGNLGVDYTSLLILKNAYFENKCEELSDKINRLENEMMILRDFIKQKIK